jgi:hypothetical protein
MSDNSTACCAAPEHEPLDMATPVANSVGGLPLTVLDFDTGGLVPCLRRPPCIVLPVHGFLLAKYP